MAKEATTAEKKTGMAAFTFQFEEPRCRGVLINSLKSSMPFRSKWSLAIINANGGADIGSAMQRMPAIPGLNFAVIPKDRTIVVTDPLEKDTDLLDRINAIMEEVTSIAAPGGKSCKAVPPQTIKLTDDEFKTVMTEFAYYNSDACAIRLDMIKGTFPSDEQIAKLPGGVLYDVRSNSHIQPKYVADVQSWHERLVFHTQ